MNEKLISRPDNPLKVNLSNAPDESIPTIRRPDNTLSTKVQSGKDDDPQTLKYVFRGGCKTAVEAALLKPGEFSMIQNMRNMHPGLKKRKGCIKLHSTADGANEVMSLFQFSKGKITERHFYAQMSDGDVLEATTAPPGVTVGAFGSEVFDGTSSGQIPASWSISNDKMFYSNGSDNHKVYTGNTSPVDGYVIYKGGEAIPTIPSKGIDYTSEVTDTSTSTYAVLDALGDLAVDYDSIFIMTEVQANAYNITMTADVNTNTATLNGYYRKNDGTNATLTISSDTTSSGGKSHAQTGVITVTVPTDEIPSYKFGRVGYWRQFYLTTGQDLSATVHVESVTYEAAWQDIVNLWDGYQVDIIEAQLFDNSATIYKTFGASLIEIDSFEATNDKLYFCTADPIEGFYVSPDSTPNTTATTTINAVYYWDGDSFESVGTVTDGSSGLSSPGWVTFARKSAVKTMFGANKTYGYWYYFTTDKTLNDNVIISMSYMPYFDITKWGKGLVNCAWKDRMAYVFSRWPNWVALSTNWYPFTLNGYDFAWEKAGDGRNNKIVAMKNFYQELIIYQEEKGVDGGCITMLEGLSPSTYGKLIISDRIGAMNSKSVVVVDGVRTSMNNDIPVAKLAFNLSRYGVFQCDGKNITSISDDIANYFDPTKDECIRRGYESKMWLKYDSSFGVLRLGLVSGSTATLPNIFPVYDLVDGTWSFDNLTQEFACMEEVEAASGNVIVLQVAGGIDDGYVYLSNSGANDVSTAIDAYATMEINAGGDIININELVLRLKSGEGSATITPYQDGSAQSTITVP